MKRWFRNILWKLLSRPVVRSVEWSVEEEAAFAIFLSSPCGKKFFEFLRQTVAHATFNAVYRDAVSAAVANGHARGQQDILGLIVRMGRFPPGVESDTLEESIEPTPAQRQRMPVDGRAFGLSGNSAI